MDWVMRNARGIAIVRKRMRRMSRKVGLREKNPDLQDSTS
jgi:hypothetical protein